MARAFQFDVGPVVEQLNRILQMELAAVIYYTHYSFMIYGHARIPITSWLRDNATESLAHAQEAGEMIMRLHRRPALGIAALPTTPHNTIDEILTESIQREESGVELYRELLALVKDKSVVLEEYATRLVGRGRTPPRNGAYVDEAGARLERVLTLGLRPYELTTATASISIMKSGPARRVTPTVVLVGVATPK